MLSRRAALKGGVVAAGVAAVVPLAAPHDRDPAIEAAESFRASLTSLVGVQKAYTIDDPEIARSGRYYGSDLHKSCLAFTDAFDRLGKVEASSVAGVVALLGCVGLCRAAGDEFDAWAQPLYRAGHPVMTPYFSMGWHEFRIVANAREGLERLAGRAQS